MERKLVEVAYEITYDCNLRCSHCYNAENLSRHQGEMTTDQSLEALYKLRDFGASKLKIGGGEPLMRKDFFDVFNYAKSLGYEVNFSSNGILVLPNMRRLVDSGVDKMQISLDNVGEKHDNIRNYGGLHKIVEESVKKLNENGVKINIATTLMRSNLNDLEEIFNFCRENKIYRWKIMKYLPKKGIDGQDPLMPSRKEYRDAVNLLFGLKNRCREWPEVIVAREFNMIKTPSDYNDMKCFGGKSFISLKPDGSVTPCSYIDDIICGNVTKQTIEEIWNSKSMLDFSKDICPETCQHAETCRGGCKAVSYLLDNKISCDPYCFVEMLNSKHP